MHSRLICNKARQEKAILVLSHGAGATMDSYFMTTIAEQLCNKGITVVRFEFPYMYKRRTIGKQYPPDRQPILLDCWGETLDKVKKNTSNRSLFIGGKSMGGRMATLFSSERRGCDGISGIVCFGYPFYAVGKQDKPRINHLKEVSIPHLIIQGERDIMGDKRTVTDYPLAPNVMLRWLEDGNHDLKPRKKTGFTHELHIEKAVEFTAVFIEHLS